MKVLLDTHVLLWALGDDDKLNAAHRELLESGAQLHVSAVTIWEIEIKRALGKLDAPGDISKIARGAGCLPLAITWQHAETAGRLPPIHGDPFDRLLIAQAQIEAMPIASVDRRFSDYGIETV